MAKLRIVSWNLRTFGDPAPPEVALQSIADIIVYQLQADIVCIQEVQAGSEAEPTTIGADISPVIDQSLAALCDALETREAVGSIRSRG
jgi:endonuclease/exonuclease/phosphatase family metal-dependent hydrolase